MGMEGISREQAGALFADFCRQTGVSPSEENRSKVVDHLTRLSRTDAETVSALLIGKNPQGRQTELPTLPPPPNGDNDDKKDLNLWVGLPSPGAIYAALIVDNAAEQRRQNRESIVAQGMEIVGRMEDEADKIREGASQRFACAVAAGVVSFVASAVQLGMACNAMKSENVDVTLAKGQAVQGMMGAGAQIINAGGEYAQSLRSAEAKKLQAEQERIRTMMEQTKQTNEALRDLIAKALDFMNSMQQSMNQTRTRILG